jgi:serine/threonine protein kinase/roadblock/LC7 domain-containing protein
MGEVYRARDTTLGREVALKTLPALVATDPERRARFAREAQTLAALNDPHIAQIYGFEQSKASSALVMELVDGEDLAARLERGAIPLDEALPIARQIAQALEAAHDAGIIHRDLKPANIKLRPNGAVKVLDFGLAKALHPPTITTPAAMTVQGMILGTAAYMSPEQARGKAVDKRADIWAFGCVLYEMLSGRRPFDGGESTSDAIAAILRQDPDWTALPPTPPHVVAVLKRCLQKDAARRARDIGDVRLELEDAPATAAQPPTPFQRAALGEANTRRTAWIAALAAVLAGSLASAATYVWRAPADEPETLLELNTPQTSDPASLAVSPNGRELVFAAESGGVSRLWHRSLSSPTITPLNGTEHAVFPFWSPDSKSVAFFADLKLKRVGLTGVAPQAIADAPVPRGGTWGPDGIILFAPSTTGVLYRVPATGGTPVPVTRLDANRLVNHRFPRFLPDGRRFLLFAPGVMPEAKGIYVASLDSPDPQYLFDADSLSGVSQDSVVYYAKQGTLFARRLDPASLQPADEPITITSEVAADPAIYVSAAHIGGRTLVYRSGSQNVERFLAWLDASGKTAGVVGDADDASPRGLSLSPDGRRVALHRTVNGNTDIWLVDIARGVRTRLTFDPAVDTSPVWSPDGSRIVFTSNRGGTFDLYVKRADGIGDDELLLKSGANKIAVAWSPDGKLVVYRQSTPQGIHLWAVPVSADRQPFVVVGTPFENREAQFSPDGKWLAYQSNESGRFEIYVQPFPAGNAKSQVSVRGGTQPRWSRDGKSLWFIGLDSQLFTIPTGVARSGEFDHGVPTALFPTLIAGGPIPATATQQYDVASDGRVLMIVRPENEATSPLTVILNWSGVSQ